MIINYSGKHITNAFQLTPEGLLFEDKLRPQFTPDISKVSDLPVIFGNKSSLLGFDVFAAVFYLLSRYEEYFNQVQRDKFGRYMPQNSILYKMEVLEKPIIEHWLLYFAKHVKKQTGITFKRREFSSCITFDIDNMYAFKNRGLVRKIGAAINDTCKKDWSNLKARLKTFLKLQADPFDNYHYMHQRVKQAKADAIYFILLSNLSDFDSKYSPRHKKLHKIIQQIATNYQVGTHASYYSNTAAEAYGNEKNILENLLKRKVTANRQHYLILYLPTSYQKLIQHQVTSDYSLMYAQLPGFRAGTSIPFYFYDLVHEKQTTLRVHPTAVMDVTLNQYMGMGLTEAIDKNKQIIEAVKEVSGNYICLWHNESLGNWKHWYAWRSVFEETLNELTGNIK